MNVSQQINYNFILKDLESSTLPNHSYLYAKVEITWLDGTSMCNNCEANLTSNEFNLFRNVEYIIDGKCIENIDYVGIMTSVKFTRILNDYSEAQLLACFGMKIKPNSLIPSKAENEFESAFAPPTADGGTITIKRNNGFNSGPINRLHNT